MKISVCSEPGCPELTIDRYCDSHVKDNRSPSSRATGRRDHRKLKAKVLERDNFICQYCGGPADQADHKIPVSKGGKSTMENEVAACAPCNNRKKDKLTA